MPTDHGMERIDQLMLKTKQNKNQKVTGSVSAGLLGQEIATLLSVPVMWKAEQCVVLSSVSLITL